MIIIGADFHPAYQEIASVNTDTGEYQERRLAHPKEAEEFYRSLASEGQAVRVGMEASGQAQWFERLLEGLRLELWRGDAEVIRAKRGRKQKTDREDARHILKLLLKDDFPRIWVPSWENRDLRQLLWHRHRMVQARTRVASASTCSTVSAAARRFGKPTLTVPPCILCFPVGTILPTNAAALGRPMGAITFFRLSATGQAISGPCPSILQH